jgi:hypothetical protein
MKAAAIILFAVAIFAVVALVNLNSGTPSAFVVQPAKDRVLGYCPVKAANMDCYLGGRQGVCTCQTVDQYRPLYWQRNNCACVVPSYLQGVWQS